MGFFDGLADAPPIRSQYGPLHDYWYQPIAGPSSTGQVVSADRAMAVSAVNTCVRIISETVASVPCVVEEHLNESDRRRARNHPLYYLLNEQPNEQMSAYELWEWCAGVTALRGEAICELVPGPRGPVDQIIPLHPDRVMIVRWMGGAAGPVLRYRIQDVQDGSFRTLLNDQVFHVRWTSMSDGLTALSPIGVLRESIGWALATENYGNRFFSQAARPAGVLEHPGKLKPEAKDYLKESIREQFAGNNVHSTMVLEEGMKWQTIGLSNEDSQFLESRKQSRVELAGAYRIPPHMIGEMDKETTWGSGIEQMQIGFIVFTMLPWFRRIEQAAKRDLILAKDRFSIRFIIDGLMRGDQKSRFEGYQIGRNMGMYSVNELRALEGMNSIGPEGDTRMQPMNMAPLGSAPAPGPVPSGQAHLIVHEIAAGLVRKEIAAIGKAARRSASDPDGWRSWVREFYGGHAPDLMRLLRLTEADARGYCERQAAALIAEGAGVMDEWEAEQPERLVCLALGG